MAVHGPRSCSMSHLYASVQFCGCGNMATSSVSSYPHHARLCPCLPRDSWMLQAHCWRRRWPWELCTFSAVESRTLAVSPTNMHADFKTWCCCWTTKIHEPWEPNMESLACVGRRCLRANLRRIAVPVASLSNILKAPGWSELQLHQVYINYQAFSCIVGSWFCLTDQQHTNKQTKTQAIQWWSWSSDDPRLLK